MAIEILLQLSYYESASIAESFYESKEVNMLLKGIKGLFAFLRKCIEYILQASHRDIIITNIQERTVFGLKGLTRQGVLKYYYTGEEPSFEWSKVPKEARPFEWGDGRKGSGAHGSYLAFNVKDTAVPGKYLYSPVGLSSPLYQIAIDDKGGLPKVDFKVYEKLVTPLITLDNNKANLIFENITGKIRLMIITTPIQENTGGGEIEIDIIPP